MDKINKKVLKRCFAVLLAVALIVTVGHFFAKDSKLHAQEVASEEVTEEAPQEPEDISEGMEDLAEGPSDDNSGTEQEEAPVTEQAETQPVEETSTDEDSAAEEATAADAEVVEEEEYEFDPESAYADYQNMSLEELNDYLAGLSEEELAALEEYAASLDEEAEEFEEAENTYTVTFCDWDGTELTTQLVAEGGRAVPPEVTPTREGYVFRDWDKDFTIVNEDMVVTAVYVTEEEASVLDALEVTIDFEDLTNERMQFGDTIKLYSTVSGLPEGRNLIYQWQYSRNGGLTWENAENASVDTYEYVITTDNYTFKWRLNFTVV